MTRNIKIILCTIFSLSAIVIGLFIWSKKIEIKKNLGKESINNLFTEKINENPLVDMNKNGLLRIVPMYPIRCNEIIFEKPDKKSNNFRFCLNEIHRRFRAQTGNEISDTEILDADARNHWLAVMKH